LLAGEDVLKVFILGCLLLSVRSRL